MTKIPKVKIHLLLLMLLTALLGACSTSAKQPCATSSPVFKAKVVDIVGQTFYIFTAKRTNLTTQQSHTGVFYLSADATELNMVKVPKEHVRTSYTYELDALAETWLIYVPKESKISLSCDCENLIINHIQANNTTQTHTSPWPMH